MSGSFERFLIERVVRVPTRVMASSRRASRQRGKSDRSDALAVARAALAEGMDMLPTAQLAGRVGAGDLAEEPAAVSGRLLVDHRELRLMGRAVEPGCLVCGARLGSRRSMK